MTTLSKTAIDTLLNEAMARAQAVALPYDSIIKEIAAAANAQKAASDQAGNARVKLWDSFKKALSIAGANGHTPTSLRIGLEVGCEHAGVPSGSFRSYVNTVVQLYTDIQEGKLTLADALNLTITEARARYRKVTPLDEAKQALTEAIKGWTADEITHLVELARAEADETTIQEVVVIAEKHVKEAQEEQEKKAA